MGLLFSPYLEHGYVKEVRARFFGMVYVGDELTVGSRVTRAEKTEEGCLHALKVGAKRGEDIVASDTVISLLYEMSGTSCQYMLECKKRRKGEHIDRKRSSGSSYRGGSSHPDRQAQWGVEPGAARRLGRAYP